MDEVSIRRKKQLGHGAHHSIYNFEYFKDKIIRTRYHDVIIGPSGNAFKYSLNKLDLKEIELFNRYPEVFVKVFKYTERYAILEKLDTSPMIDESTTLCYGILRYINAHGNGGTPDGGGFNQKIYLTSEPEDMDASWLLYNAELTQQFVTLLTNYCDRKLLTRYVNFILRANRVPKFLDMKWNNIGYNSEGRIKMLDA